MSSLKKYVLKLLELTEPEDKDGGVYISENPGEFEAGYGDGQRRRINVK